MSWRENLKTNIIIGQQQHLVTSVNIGANIIILVLIFFSLGIFVAETYHLPKDLKLLLKALDTVILIIFTIEYIIRFSLSSSKTKFVFNVYSIIDIVSILPLFLGFFDIKFIRVFRCFRFLRFFRFFDLKLSILNIKREDSVIYSRILLTLFSIIFVYSGLIYQVEHPLNSKVFNNFGDALYFSVVTMTTVGFGDITPISDTGKLLTVLMILTGVAVIPWQIGDFIKQFIKTVIQVGKTCPGCGLSLHEADANYCKICSTKLIPTGSEAD